MSTIVPWRSWSEFLQLFPHKINQCDDAQDTVEPPQRHRARLLHGLVSAWSARSATSVPNGLVALGEIEVALEQVGEAERERQRRGGEGEVSDVAVLRHRASAALTAAAAIVRVVNAITEEASDRYSANSLANLSRSIGLPIHLVSLRHALTHSWHLPSLPDLSRSLHLLSTFLENGFVQAQCDQIQQRKELQRGGEGGWLATGWSDIVAEWTSMCSSATPAGNEQQWPPAAAARQWAATPLARTCLANVHLANLLSPRATPAQRQAEQRRLLALLALPTATQPPSPTTQPSLTWLSDAERATTIIGLLHALLRRTVAKLIPLSLCLPLLNALLDALAQADTPGEPLRCLALPRPFVLQQPARPTDSSSSPPPLSPAQRLAARLGPAARRALAAPEPEPRTVLTVKVCADMLTEVNDVAWQTTPLGLVPGEVEVCSAIGMAVTVVTVEEEVRRVKRPRLAE